MVARWHRRSGNRSTDDTISELIGEHNVVLGNLLTGRLRQIFDALGMADDALQNAVERHTMLPYFKPFIEKSRYQASRRALLQTPATSLKLYLGLPSSRLGAANPLRYCDACASSDLRTLGVPTWHRVHQLPGVLVCPVHEIALNQSNHIEQHKYRHVLFLPDEPLSQFTKAVPEPSRCAQASLLRIASLSCELLNKSKRPNGQLHALRNRYRALLERHELTRSATRVDVVALQRAVAAHWAPLREIKPFSGLLGSIGGDHDWLTSLVRKPRGVSHPLKHLMLIGAFSPTLDAFFSPPKAVIAAQNMHQGRGEPRTSSLVGDVLKLMWERGFSARQAARELAIDVHTVMTIAHREGVRIAQRPKRIFESDVAAIKTQLRAGASITKIAARTGISTASVGRILVRDMELQVQRRANRHKKQRRKMHAIYLSIRRKYPHDSATALRSREPGCYAWLYRNDRAWLRSHMPEVSSLARVSNLKGAWEQRDIELALSLGLAAKEIQASRDVPVRISVRELGRRTGKISWLEKHRAKLPLCDHVLREVVETTSAFQSRRVQWWANHLFAREGVLPAPSRVYRLAGVTYKHASDYL
ncbi:hypothetical protein PCE31106_04769 [Pandoraea cepalis]|uniref:Transposon Tn7 transposition protein TnsD C-termianl domain-containing protein n=2 Tax=Pandoraea cepalis TaxID=2508294 RepID=A0A5E4YW06_9BURK|nr:hypothetical protein PCE31106_04769 [Pandoraea cepalis]